MEVGMTQPGLHLRNTTLATVWKSLRGQKNEGKKASLAVDMVYDNSEKKDDDELTTIVAVELKKVGNFQGCLRSGK